MACSQWRAPWSSPGFLIGHQIYAALLRTSVDLRSQWDAHSLALECRRFQFRGIVGRIPNSCDIYMCGLPRSTAHRTASSLNSQLGCRRVAAIAHLLPNVTIRAYQGVCQSAGESPIVLPHVYHMASYISPAVPLFLEHRCDSMCSTAI